MARLGIVLGLTVTLALDAGAQVADHLKCYAIGSPTRFRAIVDLESRLTGVEEGCRLSEPKLVCVPTTKTVVKAPVDPLPVSGPEAVPRICYGLRCPRTDKAELELMDQFGVHVTRLREAQLLCTPAEECDPICNKDTDCDDGNECTQDVCSNPGGCSALCTHGLVHDTPCTGGVCCSGTCVPPVCTTDIECDDQDECTQDICSNPGTCSALCASGFVNGLPCSGGICCGGVCGTPVCSSNPECDDNNECTQDFCSSPGTCNALCVSGLLPNGTPCSTGVCCSGSCSSAGCR